MYIFSLSILEGEDLLKLLPTKMSLNSGFYWFYQLRGNDVIYNPFRDLGKPFPMERASMNIRATKVLLSCIFFYEYLWVVICFTIQMQEFCLNLSKRGNFSRGVPFRIRSKEALRRNLREN